MPARKNPVAGVLSRQVIAALAFDLRRKFLGSGRQDRRLDVEPEFQRQPRRRNLPNPTAIKGGMDTTTPTIIQSAFGVASVTTSKCLATSNSTLSLRRWV
jgi:hypothetical protein